MCQRPDAKETLPSAEELMAWFGFTRAELEANRLGLLSKRQHLDVFYASVGNLVRGIGTTLLAVILVAAVAPTATTPAEQRLLAVAIGLYGLIGVMWLIAALRICHPRVYIAHGRLRQSGSTAHPTITVANERLHISLRRWRRLPASLPGRYCVYYGATHTVLSLEPDCEEACIASSHP